MAKILTQTQAEHVYNAMCVLNNIGGTIESSFEMKRVSQNGDWIFVKDFNNGTIEEYRHQHDFAQAYEV